MDSKLSLSRREMLTAIAAGASGLALPRTALASETEESVYRLHSLCRYG